MKVYQFLYMLSSSARQCAAGGSVLLGFVLRQAIAIFARMNIRKEVQVGLPFAKDEIMQWLEFLPARLLTPPC